MSRKNDFRPSFLSSTSYSKKKRRIDVCSWILHFAPSLFQWNQIISRSPVFVTYIDDDDETKFYDMEKLLCCCLCIYFQLSLTTCSCVCVSHSWAFWRGMLMTSLFNTKQSSYSFNLLVLIQNVLYFIFFSSLNCRNLTLFIYLKGGI